MVGRRVCECLLSLVSSWMKFEILFAELMIGDPVLMRCQNMLLLNFEHSCCQAIFGLRNKMCVMDGKTSSVYEGRQEEFLTECKWNSSVGGNITSSFYSLFGPFNTRRETIFGERLIV
jgi:hypothetical protein